ncbi:MAG: hypothetical protein PHG96_04325 [Kiritimatiellae bacterium]|nr:hypothetical protein [Kiritimatiellia bacterium]MDD3544570.1 hypothetical protein [Kiritimatiellia bacterium]MDD4020001.1 hypothetical protein [Kiritimatiellia bacterium]MDD4622355.1 hypothetical protein [Kiritimatiellia bacterium]
MKLKRANVLMGLLAFTVTGVVAGCLSVKTEHEIKPIHITMDVNLKVQKELEDFLNLD